MRGLKWEGVNPGRTIIYFYFFFVVCVILGRTLVQRGY